MVIFPNPTATISATVHSIKLGTQTTLTGTTSTGTYSWAPATDLCCTSCSNPATCPDPVASPMATTTYTLTTTDARGCTASDTITIFVDINCELFVPNAFSPNGDGKNDYLAVRGLCIKDIDFKIFNRWGNVVFATQDPKITTDQTKGWNGSFEGKAMDPGVFFYTLHVTLLDNTTKTITGDITLVR